MLIPDMYSIQLHADALSLTSTCSGTKLIAPEKTSGSNSLSTDMFQWSALKLVLYISEIYFFIRNRFPYLIIFLSLCFRFLFLDVFFHSRTGIGCLVAGVVDVLYCFRVTFKMVPAVTEKSNDQQWYANPEREDQ